MKKFPEKNEIIGSPLYQLGEEVLDLANVLLGSFNKNEIVLRSIPPHKRIYVFFFTRALKSYSAILTLCREGYGQDIATLLRSILENLISVKYILSDLQTADEKAERFVDYKWIVYRRYISNEKRQPEEIKDILMKKLVSRKDTVMEKYQLFKEKYHLKSDKALVTWSGRSIRDMAKMTSRWLMDEYDSTFRLASRFSHPSIIGDRSYIKNKDGELTFSPFPTTVGVLMNFKIALRYIVVFLDDYNRIFDLKHDKEMETIKEALNNIPEEIPSKPSTESSTDKKELVLKFQTLPPKK